MKTKKKRKYAKRAFTTSDPRHAALVKGRSVLAEKRATKRYLQRLLHSTEESLVHLKTQRDALKQAFETLK